MPIHNPPGAGTVTDDMLVSKVVDHHGQPGGGYFYFTGIVANDQTVTVGTRVYQYQVLATDSFEVTAGNELNNVTNPVTFTCAGHLRVVGDVVLVDNERLRVTATPTVDSLTVSRGQCGTAIIAHANGVSIYFAAANIVGSWSVGIVTNTSHTAIAALVASINEDPLREADVIPWATIGANSAGCEFAGHSVTGLDLPLATTCVKGIVSAATTTGAVAAMNLAFSGVSYNISPADVVALARTLAGVVTGEVIIGVIPSTTPPVLGGFFVRDSVDDVICTVGLSVEIAQANANYWAIILMDPLAILAAGDVITLASEVITT